MDLRLIRAPAGTLKPADDATAAELLKLPIGAIVHGEFKRMRNYKFFRKWWALITYAFDHWDAPEAEGAVKNLDRFRKDVTILAGYYDSVVNLRGEVRAEAKSIAFGSMEEAEFEKLYQATIDVILQRVLRSYTRADIDRVMNEILAFA